MDAEKFFYHSFLLIAVALLASGIIILITTFPSSSSLNPYLGWILAIIQIIAGIVAIWAAIKLYKQFG